MPSGDYTPRVHVALGSDEELYDQVAQWVDDQGKIGTGFDLHIVGGDGEPLFEDPFIGTGDAPVAFYEYGGRVYLQGVATGGTGTPDSGGGGGGGGTVEAVHIVGAAGEPAYEGSPAFIAGSPPLGFYIDGVHVHFVGMTLHGGHGEPIFTLPVGYRPSQIVNVGGVGINGWGLVLIQVGTDGVVTAASDFDHTDSGGVGCDLASFRVA